MRHGTGSRGRKGSVEMMEYMFLTLFVVAIVIAFVIFLSWWQVSQANVERSKSELDRTLALTRSMLVSPMLAKGDSMLEDARLTASASMGDFCSKAGAVYGGGWFVVVRLFDGSNETPCTEEGYPDCNYWEFCREPARKSYRSYVVPVNVYRSVDSVLETGILGRAYAGSMEVGLYS